MKKLLLMLATIMMAKGAVAAQPAKAETVVLSKDNLIVLNDAIMPQTMGEVLLKAKQLDAALSDSLTNKAKEKVLGRKTPLYIFVNSPGGSIQTGLEMVESLKGLGRPVHTVTLFAASMAWQIVQALDNRYILKNGVMMSHQAYGGFEGTFGAGGGQIDARFGLWNERLREMDEQTVKRTKGKQTLESYHKAYSQELWRTGTKSVVEGYSDAVATVKCDASLGGVDSKSIEVDLMILKVTVSYDLDQCPTNTNPMNAKIVLETSKGKMTLPLFLQQGGEFGSACLQVPGKLCASNPLLNMDRINEAMIKFKNMGQFDYTKQKPLPMMW